MPMMTQLIRNGRPVKVGGWTWWHLSSLHGAMVEENPFEDEEKTPFFPEKGVFIFQEPHIFTEEEQNIWTDGDVGKLFTLEIQPGDEYHAWRGIK